MKKILIISTTDINLTYRGDTQRLLHIINEISKKHIVDLVYLKKNSKKNIKIKTLRNITSFKTNFFFKLLNVLITLISFKPVQIGYFFSKDMKIFISKKMNEYDTVICHLIRSSQYIDKSFNGKKILEMTDIISLNYYKTYIYLAKINLIKYFYLIESYLLRLYEKKEVKKFDYVVLNSRNDVKEAKNINYKKKIKIIDLAVLKKRKIYKFTNYSNKVLFIGNIKYLPNKLACFNFVFKTLKKLNLFYRNIKFIIIGNISMLDKFILSLNNNVEIFENKKITKKFYKNIICCICNVEIYTGQQTKILNYLSLGIPSISFIKFKSKNIDKSLLYYENEDELVKKIISLKENKKLSEKLVRNGFLSIKKFYNPQKVYRKYSRLL